MAKQFLDATGLSVLWNKIKSTFLPLSGGTMTGRINYKSPNGTTLYNIATNGDVAHNGGTGFIQCLTNSGRDVAIQGGGIDISGDRTSGIELYHIRYSYDNIYIAFDYSGRRYKFDLQKFIDDGYLIKE